MRRWLLGVLIGVCLAAALGVVGVSAATIVDSGYCGGEGDGTNLTWTLDSDEVLTISGSGDMENYTLDCGIPRFDSRVKEDENTN